MVEREGGKSDRYREKRDRGKWGRDEGYKLGWSVWTSLTVSIRLNCLWSSLNSLHTAHSTYMNITSRFYCCVDYKTRVQVYLTYIQLNYMRTR